MTAPGERRSCSSSPRHDDPRGAIDRMVERFDKILAEELDASNFGPQGVAELVTAREIFLCAGAAAVERCTNPERWLQVGVEFRDHSQRQDFLDEGLANLVQRLKEEQAIDNFFFMNKPPGVRLRFSGFQIEPGLRRTVFALLEARKRQGRLHRFELGAYDGETYQFGGATGLRLFHRFSTIDCITILRLSSLARQTASQARLPCVSLLCLNHLMRAFTSGEWELWDAWRKMELADRTLSVGAQDQVLANELFDRQRSLLRTIVFEPSDAFAALTDAEQPIVRAFCEQITVWAADVHAAIRRGELLYGIRSILPFYVIFHWNRLGFDRNLQCWLTFYMQRLLDPKHGETAGIGDRVTHGVPRE